MYQSDQQRRGGPPLLPAARKGTLTHCRSTTPVEGICQYKAKCKNIDSSPVNLLLGIYLKDTQILKDGEFRVGPDIFFFFYLECKCLA